MDGPLFVFTGIRYRNFENTCITVYTGDYHCILRMPVHLTNRIPTFTLVTV